MAAGINPVDLVIARDPKTLPYVPGREGVVRLNDGSRAYVDIGGSSHGLMAERTLVDPARTFALPDGLSDGMAIAIGIAGLAAWLAVEKHGRLAPGESVLVLGATGVVGQIAVQSAKLLGAGRVVAAGRDRRVLEGLRAADDIVVLDDDPTAAIRRAAGDGFDVVLDPLFGDYTGAALKATAPGARIVSVGRSASPTATIALGDLFGRTHIGHSSAFTRFEDRRSAYAKLAAHASSGLIAVGIERLPLSDVSGVWRRQASGSPHRKVILIPGADAR